MPDTRVMSYNVEWMNNLFSGNTVKASEQERAHAIAGVIDRVDPHVLAISEAANSPEEHQHFIDTFLGGRFTLAHGASRGAQNLVLYFREPYRSPEIDKKADFYDPWNEDIDGDKVTERFTWERRPLEVVFRIGQGGQAPRIRFILVHTKSKGVFSVVDLAGYQKEALGSRKKLAAQAVRLRERLDSLSAASAPLPTVVLGDMNDGPGLDPYERVLGRSFVETVMGSVFFPERIYHNVLHWMTGTADDRKDLWTADFPDPIVNHPFNWRHRVWLDHILVSPDILSGTGPVSLVPGSGAIDVKDGTSRKASDHFAVHCTLRT